MPATSIYGTAKRKITYKRRIKHKIKPYTRKGKKISGYTGRRWHKITGIVGKPIHQKRFTFYGTTKDINKAKRIMEKESLIPKAVFPKYEDGIDAHKYATNKKYREEHSIKGEWIDFEEKES